MPSSDKPFVSAFTRHIKKQFPLIIGQKLVLAVSGGLDSMAMLHLFMGSQKKLAITPVVAHIDHNLRPDSGRDAQFVDNFCQEWGVKCYLSRINEVFWAEGKGNIEDRARRERYRLLEQIARKQHTAYIVTAHHRDDQAETVLMRVLDRGTGLHGLGGIAEVSVRGRFKYIRPLLPFSREQLALFMADRMFVEDETNRDTTMRRNLFRHEVIPFLKRSVSREVNVHLAQLSDNARYHNEVLAVALDHFWASHRMAPRSSRYLLSQQEIAGLPDHFMSAALSHLVRMRRSYGFGARTVQDMIGFLRNPESLFCNYNCVTVRKSKGIVVFRLFST